MSDYQPGDTIAEIFRHPNSGVADSAFTKNLFKSGALVGITVTITEPETNLYRFSFETDSTDRALYELDIQETANPTDGTSGGRWKVFNGEPVDVVLNNGFTNTLPESVINILSTMQSLLESIRGLVRRGSTGDGR